MGQTWGKLPLFDPVWVDLRELQRVRFARMNEPSVVRPKRALHDAGLLGEPSQVHALRESDRDIRVLSRVQVAPSYFQHTLRDAEDFVEAPLIDGAAKGILEDVIVRSGVQLDHLPENLDISS